MHYTTSLAAIGALSSLTTALPSPSTSWKQHFSIKQSATGRKIPRSGAIAYRNALAKYGVDIPDAVVTAVSATQNGSVPANPTQYDSQYLSPVSVGGQTLMLDFDTGSADLWCFSSELPTNQQNGQAIYNPAKSATAQRKDGYTWSISYGDQSGASGTVYADTVRIGGVTATSQAVEAATSVSSQFSSDAENDGLVGFAFSKINTVRPVQAQTWFDTVKASLPQPLFAVSLKYQEPGTYDFGFVDEGKFEGGITYTAVDSSQGFWGFSAEGYTVGSKATTGSLSAIADTGTSLVLLSTDIVDAYYAAVPGAQESYQAGGWIVPCSASLPDFGLTIGGKSFGVPGEYVKYAPLGDGTCYGGIQSSAGIGFNILGDVWLKGLYVVFEDGEDGEGARLGFARQAGIGGGGMQGNGTFSVPRMMRPRR